MWLDKLPLVPMLKVVIHIIRLKTARPRDVGTIIMPEVRSTRDNEPRINSAAILTTNSSLLQIYYITFIIFTALLSLLDQTSFVIIHA